MTPPKRPFKNVEKSGISPSGPERKKQKRLPPKFSYDYPHPFFSYNANVVFCSEPDVMVTFLIGPEPSPKKFIVHKEIACRHSGVFDAAFNSEFIEGQTQTYRLEDTSEEVFRMLVQWMYGKQLDLISLEGKVVIVKEDLTQDMHLAELWVLADRLGMPWLQNRILDHIDHIRRQTNSMPTATFHYVYDNTASGSPLRKYFVWICAMDLNPAVFTEVMDQFPKSMLASIAKYLSKLRIGIFDDEDSEEVTSVSAFYIPVDED
jgi:hypothetical protein